MGTQGEIKSIPQTTVLHTTKVPGASSHRDTERGFWLPGADIHTALCPRGNASYGIGAGGLGDESPGRRNWG